MYTKVSLGLILVILAAAYAGDTEECKKIRETFGCCRLPKETGNENDLMEAFIGNKKELVEKFKTCLEDKKDELKNAKPDEVLGSVECLAECVFNGTKLMTPELKFNQEIAFKLFEADPEYKEFAKKHMQICEEKTTKVPESAKCKGSFVNFVMCFLEQAANNCPLGGPKAGTPVCENRNINLDKCNPLAFMG